MTYEAMIEQHDETRANVAHLLDALEHEGFSDCPTFPLNDEEETEQ